ncbi:Isopenicillin N epimerase [Frondihabitans sp. 762G35]|uniref:aminotransferase class V-fold PLP-dependent enzyme n=1 Tax=Frondihabitans sp. 762G35 TaxID=1446794 RepID=UPI000D2244A1|nr:aminotransferase class V-fold PLP-dependent enzyme [Frondihabitans sp. 762G35]ARC57090.1 Isopenicillin N epimerase [Frondihabitans sp. 762G35]
MTTPPAAVSLDEARAEFPRGTGYLAACTGGLPPTSAVRAMRADLESWSTGHLSPVRHGETAEATRAAFARLVGVRPELVALGSQTSAMVAVLAASVPDGAEVLVPEGDFSSLVMPFRAQAHRGVRVRVVPLGDLAPSILPSTWLVAYSLVQSATGETAADDEVVRAAAAAGARTLVDLTQAAGVVPVDASRYDATVTHAYKWLCAPRGVAFLTIGERLLEEVRPVQTGWYAGSDVWASCYGADVELAADARRFDVSPAWQAFVGALPALELFASVAPVEVARHAGDLGDALCRSLGLPPHGRAIVTWPDSDGRHFDALTRAGLTVSGRAGRVRVAFHLWNDHDDVERVVTALRGTAPRGTSR